MDKQKIIDALAKHTDKFSQSSSSASHALEESGIYDKDGNLTENYKDSTPRVYTYACSVCKTEYKWSVPEPKFGKTCPMCRSAMMDEMVAWGEAQGKDEERLVERMDDWWNGLPKDAQEKAFFCVVKRIVDAELVKDMSYRQILHDEFGFDQGAYYMGIICGFMSLHNSIVPPAELAEMRQALREKKDKK